jgi:endonuclease/exonuclease/phosphatase family metal-dependent hydrolase
MTDASAGSDSPPADARAEPGKRLSLLSANIQAGARTDSYSDYVSKPWAHVLPHPTKRGNLDQLAGLLSEFDLVGLQEADPGSLRSGFLNQTHYLAEAAGFPFWSHQPNRRVGPIASSANGLLSRIEPDEVRDYPLPGRIPGRGVLWARYGEGPHALIVLIAHLSLSAKARMVQLGYLGELLQEAPHGVLMGDFNCESDAAEMRMLYRQCRLLPPDCHLPTFPSWRPQRAIDHILATEGVRVERRWALPSVPSDHLATAAVIELP